MSELSNLLRAHRSRNHMTQADVADALNISRAAVANWENDNARPTSENLNALAQLYGANYYELEAANARDDFVEEENKSSRASSLRNKQSAIKEDYISNEIMLIDSLLDEYKSRIDLEENPSHKEKYLKRYNSLKSRRDEFVINLEKNRTSKSKPDQREQTARAKAYSAAPSNEISQLALPFSLDKLFPAAHMVGSRDLPVYASAQGGLDGELVDTSTPIDYVRRPEMLERIQAAFAVYVVGDSMEPRFESGDLVLVNPTKVAYAGQDVILMSMREDGTCAALVKRLVRQSDDTIEVLEYNPEKRTFTLPRVDWPHVFPIVGIYARR